MEKILINYNKQQIVLFIFNIQYLRYDEETQNLYIKMHGDALILNNIAKIQYMILQNAIFDVKKYETQTINLG